MLHTTTRGWLPVLILLCLFIPTAFGQTRYVSTVSEYENALNDAGSGLIDEIVLNPGEYNLTSGAYLTRGGITIRGATGNRDDVVLYGGGMNNANAVRECVQFSGPDCTLSDLTISGFFHHGVHIQNGADNILIDNVRTLNIGEHHMKGPGAWANVTKGEITGCLMDQNMVRENGLPGRPDDYLGGIDLLGVSNWNINNNVAKYIRGQNGGDAGIFLWQNIHDVVIENNILVGCNKGIALGNVANPDGAYGCTVRNNMIFSTAMNDIGLELANTGDTQVLNNTIFRQGREGVGFWFRTLQIYGDADNLNFQNNILHGGIYDLADGTWNETVLENMGNLVDTTGSGEISELWFEDAANGDLHLTREAVAAIGAGVVHPDALLDFDGQERDPVGSACDMGADEFYPKTINYKLRINGEDLSQVSKANITPGEAFTVEILVNCPDADMEGLPGGVLQYSVNMHDSGDALEPSEAIAGPPNYDPTGLWDSSSSSPMSNYAGEVNSQGMDVYGQTGQIPPGDFDSFYDAFGAGEGVWDLAGMGEMVWNGEETILTLEPGSLLSQLLYFYGPVYPKNCFGDLAMFIDEDPGDIDMDGDVDSSDLATLGLNWAPDGEGLSWEDGDFDGDGNVGPEDLAYLGLNWSPDGTVPEPASLGALLCGAAMLLRRRRNTTA